MGSEAPASMRPASKRPTWQAARQVSMTRTAMREIALERLLHPGDLGDVVAQQVLDAGLQSGGGRRTAGAGAAHVEPDHAGVGLEAGEQDVAAVLRHGRADAGVDQVLDLGDHLGGLALIDLVVMALGLAAED